MSEVVRGNRKREREREERDSWVKQSFCVRSSLCLCSSFVFVSDYVCACGMQMRLREAPLWPTQ